MKCFVPVFGESKKNLFTGLILFYADNFDILTSRF